MKYEITHRQDDGQLTLRINDITCLATRFDDIRDTYTDEQINRYFDEALSNAIMELDPTNPDDLVDESLLG